MAKSKQSAAPPRSHALDHGEEAAGAATIREGIALRPEDDLLLALGWPHLRFVVDGHRDDKDPEKNVNKAIASLEGHYGDVWPAEVATRYVHAFGARPGAFNKRVASVKEAIAQEGVEVDEARAEEWLGRLFTRPGFTRHWFVEHFVFLVEAFVGSDLVLESLVSGLESMGELSREEEASYAAYTTGMLMLRVPETAAQDAHNRLAAVRDRRKRGLVFDRLTLVMGGAQAARDKSLNPMFYHHVTDDPSAVVAAVEAGEWLPSVRLVQLGGEAVLEAFAPHWRRHEDRELQLRLVEQLAKLSSPIATQVLDEMATTSKVKKQAAEALKARG